MADNFQLFSEVIPRLSPGEAAWAERVLRSDDPLPAMAEAGVGPTDIDPDCWPGFEWELLRPEGDLWVYSHGDVALDNLARFVRAFLARFRPGDCWRLTWAETCSKPRVGEFGGGGLFVTARSVDFRRPCDWLDRRQQEFERRAASPARP